MPTGFGLPQSEIVRLLGMASQLGHPLVGGNKLGGHIPTQPCLFDMVVPVLLLLVKEPGFLLAMSDKGLKKMMIRAQKHMKKEEGERQGQVNTRSVRTMTSHRAPLA